MIAQENDTKFVLCQPYKEFSRITILWGMDITERLSNTNLSTLTSKILKCCLSLILILKSILRKKQKKNNLAKTVGDLQWSKWGCRSRTVVPKLWVTGAVMVGHEMAEKI